MYFSRGFMELEPLFFLKKLSDTRAGADKLLIQFLWLLKN